jgi:hypothetical protein
VDLEANEVADDEQRGIFKSFVVLVQLAVGLVEVRAFGFVLPGKPAALPDVGEAFLGAADLADSLFKGVTGADLVDFRGVGNAERLAEVTKMLWRGRTLSKRAGVPLADEIQQINWHRALGYCDRAGGIRHWRDGSRLFGL